MTANRKTTPTALDRLHEREEAARAIDAETGLLRQAEQQGLADAAAKGQAVAAYCGEHLSSGMPLLAASRRARTCIEGSES